MSVDYSGDTPYHMDALPNHVVLLLLQYVPLERSAFWPTMWASPRGMASQVSEKSDEQETSEQARSVNDFYSQVGLCQMAAVCRSLRNVVLSLDNDAILFRKQVLISIPHVVWSAIDRNTTLASRSWRGLFKNYQLRSVTWSAVKSEDSEILTKPNLSRTSYVVVRGWGAGGSCINCFLRVGGHYFFKLATQDYSSYHISPTSGAVRCGKWKTARVHGTAPEPRRGFTLLEVSWQNTFSELVRRPAVLVFGGGSTSYPFQESNGTHVAVPLRTCVSGSRKDVEVDRSFLWIWLRVEYEGSPPETRRGCRAKQLGRSCHHRAVFVGGAQTSPPRNFNDLHILTTVLPSTRFTLERVLDKLTAGVMPGADIREYHRAASSAALRVQAGEALIMRWEKVVVDGPSLYQPGRFAHALDVSSSVEHTSGGRSTTLLVYGGTQLNGKTALFDAHLVRLELDEQGNGDSSEERIFPCFHARRLPVPLRGDAVRDPEGATAIYCGKLLLLCGGYDRNTLKTENCNSGFPISVFDSENLTWRTPAVSVSGVDIPETRCGHRAEMQGDSLLISGGYAREGNNIRARIRSKTDALRLDVGGH